jgi:hypothetical protein
LIVTEIVENDAGEPCWFVAEREELSQSIAGIPADVLCAANESRWLNCGLEPPKRSIHELRQRLLDKHEQAARRMADEHVLPVEEAARHLDLTGRVLHYRIQQGEFEDVVRELPGGRIGLSSSIAPTRGYFCRFNRAAGSTASSRARSSHPATSAAATARTGGRRGEQRGPAPPPARSRACGHRRLLSAGSLLP